MRRYLDLLVPALAACGVVVALDQGTKALATSLVSRGDRSEVLPFLAFENVRNKGVACVNDAYLLPLFGQFRDLCLTVACKRRAG